MRIVMLGPFGLHPKGTMRARAVPAARALALRGHQVTVIMPPWHTPENAGQAWAGDIPGVRLEYVDLTGLWMPGAGHLLIAARMVRRALALEPDVVHAFKPKAYSGLAAWLLWMRRMTGRMMWRRSRSQRPAIVVDTDDWEGPGGWNSIEPYNPLMQRFFTWQERWGLTHADAVTVASRELETLASSLGAPAHQVAYLPNAVDDSSASPAASSSNPESNVNGAAASSPPTALRTSELSSRPTMLLFTRFHDFALEFPFDVLDNVRKHVPEARLIVAGRGLFGEEEDFERAAMARGLGDAVEMVGWVEAEEADDLFASADVAIAPFDDTLVNRSRSSMKLIDLLSAGVPVVAESVGEARELIADGRNGRLVACGDAAAFAAAVVELLGDATVRETMGQAAVADLRRDHVWSRRVERLEAVYVEALARSQNSSRAQT